MEHESNNIGLSAELPQPQADLSKAGYESSKASAPELNKQAGIAATPVKQPPTIQASNSVTDDGSGTSSTASQPVNSHITSDLMADDTDLIEKEWVLKAKAIVAQTKDDPHLQNHEMTKVKADYLKKRYNKDLKVSKS